MWYRDVTDKERSAHMNMTGSTEVQMRLVVPVEPVQTGWWCGHLKHFSEQETRDAQYCRQGHLVSTWCGEVEIVVAALKEGA